VLPFGLRFCRLLLEISMIVTETKEAAVAAALRKKGADVASTFNTLAALVELRGAGHGGVLDMLDTLDDFVESFKL
jgi:hypothetical protein